MTTAPRDGLLEQAALVVRPLWEGVARQSLEDTSGRAVGEAVWGLTRGLPRWLGWLARPVLAVYEAGEDRPLVCVAERLWALSPLWEVRDADGHVVGQVYGPLVQDRAGRVHARRVRGAGRYEDEAGREVLLTAAGPGGRTVTFGAGVHNPFVRMLLLCAALVGEG